MPPLASEDVVAAATVLLGGCLKTGSGVGVIVALKYKIDVVLVEDRLPELADLGVVSIFGRRINRVVERDDGPAIGVLAQDLMQPLGLLLQVLTGIQRDHPDALVIDVVCGFFQPFGAVLGQLRTAPASEPRCAWTSPAASSSLDFSYS